MFVHMGTITRPHGIRGEMCVDWYADSPELLSGTFFLQTGDQPPQKISQATYRLHCGQPLLRLPQVHDRTCAEGLRGVRILVARELLPPPSENEAYLHDVLGLVVVDVNTNQSIGILEDVMFVAGQDIWSIRTQQGVEVLFPAVPEFIEGFDLDAGMVRIAPPEGLLQIYLA